MGGQLISVPNANAFNIAMIIYLYGPDAYRRQQKLNEILGKYKEKHSALSVARFDFTGKEELSKFKDFATAQSLFDTYKFGILYGAEEAEAKELNPILESILDSKTIIIALVAEKNLHNLTALGKKDVINQNFENLEGSALDVFVRAEAGKRGLKFSGEIPGDSWTIVTELDKMALGGSPEAVFGGYNFFNLMRQAMRGDLSALTVLLEKEEPAMVFNVMASQSSGPAKIKMADYDVAIKSGKLDYPEALLDLALGSN